MGQELQYITARGVQGKIFQAMEAAEQASWLSDVCMDSPSTSADEEYAWLGHSPTFREWKGPRVIKRLSEYHYTLRNKKYEGTLGIAQDDLDRDKVGMLNIRIADFAKRPTTHWASLISSLITDNGICYDDQNFYDTDHSEGDSGTQSNTLTKTDYTELDFATTEKPTALEMSSAIWAVIGHMYTLKDDVGEPINEDAKSFLITVPTVYYWRALQQALTSDTVVTSGGASVDNPLKGSGLSVRGQFNSRLNVTSYTQYFYVTRTDTPIKAFIKQQEGSVVQQHLGQDSDHFFKNDEQLWGLKTKRAAGYGLWQTSIRADGTT